MERTSQQYIAQSSLEQSNISESTSSIYRRNSIVPTTPELRIIEGDVEEEIVSFSI
jgi:hypothetical protein